MLALNSALRFAPRPGLATIVGIIVLLPVFSAVADSWVPFQAVRATDPDGRRYVVISPPNAESDKTTYVIAAVPKDGDSVSPAEGKEAKVRPGDRVIRRGAAPITPQEVLVLPPGFGFVLIDQYGNLGYGATVVFVDDRGGVGPVLELSDIFTEEERGHFTLSTSSVWWRRNQWVDVEARLLFVASHVGVRAIDWQTGKVRPAVVDDFRRAVTLADPAARAIAMEILTPEMDPAWNVLSGAAARLTDPKESLRVRLRAATLVARYAAERTHRPKGERREAVKKWLPIARDLVGVTAFEPSDSVSADDRHHAILSSGAVLGTAAIPHLRELLRNESEAYWDPLLSAFRALGNSAASALLEMAFEVHESSNYRGAAAHLLGEVGVFRHGVALADLIADSDEYVANAAANSAIRLGSTRLAPTLIELLERGTSQDALLVLYFTTHRHRDSVAVLIQCLERTSSDQVRDTAVRALVHQTGKSFGKDPKVWRKELGL